MIIISLVRVESDFCAPHLEIQGLVFYENKKETGLRGMKCMKKKCNCLFFLSNALESSEYR